uniref:Uncharacterized protein n=1 Tax=Rhizophora mucronata TaxID=61149 RepID=A0A2P2PXH9_RHIMU
MILFFSDGIKKQRKEDLVSYSELPFGFSNDELSQPNCKQLYNFGLVEASGFIFLSHFLEWDSSSTFGSSSQLMGRA